MSETKRKPLGTLAIKTQCMPADTNPAGDIFGGWLLAQMDIAGASICKRIADIRVVTVAIDSMTFIAPVYVGDLLHCYVEVKKMGNSSITVQIEAWVQRQFGDELILVTEGQFVYVAVDEHRNPVKFNKPA